jgi:DNA-directed RNA polymerase specialized sigma24 family protein
MISPLPSSAPSRMYFSEEEAQRLITQYKNTIVMVDGVIVSKNEDIENRIMAMIRKIVIAIINNYRYYIFEEYEDLIQAGLEACFKGLPRYKEDKGSAFNYFSIIAKTHLLNYTDRRKKHRGHLDIEEQEDIEGYSEESFELTLNNLRSHLFNKIDRNFIKAKRKKFTKITLILLDYLEKSRKIINKSDLYAWSRSYGVKPIDIREYMSCVGSIVGIENE